MSINSNIAGNTKVYGIIGRPIHHSFSPILHNTIANRLKKDFVYIPMLVESGNLEEAIKGAFALNIRGINVTVPYKVDVIKHLYKLDKRAEIIGAVNTLKYTQNGYIGYNTDIIGAYYAISNKGYTVAGKSVLLLGAGGAANALAVMAVENKCKKLYIANRTVEKAKKLANSISKHYEADIEVCSIEDINNIKSVDIIINSTTIGFEDKRNLSPIEDINFYKAKGISLVFDAIYTPWNTKLLLEAKGQGVDIINGFDMLIYQGIAAQEIWFEEEYTSDFKKLICSELAKFYKENC